MSSLSMNFSIHQDVQEQSEASFYNTGIQVHLNKMSMEWFIENKSMDKHSVAATKTYGTSRMDAYSIFEDTLNLKL